LSAKEPHHKYSEMNILGLPKLLILYLPYIFGVWKQLEKKVTKVIITIKE
jgi:hypothetical protein